MNIGEASRASGVSGRMIRYYERHGLLPEAERSDAGYRIYSEADVHRLRFVRRARDLGFRMAEISELLGLWNDRSRQSADVRRLAQAHIGELRERMEQLRQMVRTLEGLVEACAGDDRPECPILAGLEQGGEGVACAGQDPDVPRAQRRGGARRA